MSAPRGATPESMEGMESKRPVFHLIVGVVAMAALVVIGVVFAITGEMPMDMDAIAGVAVVAIGATGRHRMEVKKHLLTLQEIRNALYSPVPSEGEKETPRGD